MGFIKYLVMSKISQTLLETLKSASASPFLFLGSGFSKRYIGLEDWGSLLKRFAGKVRPYEYYFGRGSGDLPEVAELIAEDFYEYWWREDEYIASREKHSSKVKDVTTPLRIEICEYLKELVGDAKKNDYHKDEVKTLSELNIDGIITTNWDRFIENIFPDHRVFVGQNELLFSNPQSIGEIYKIHGSVTAPSSLVLTKSDYNKFQAVNPYLAAKLITIFVEHPIIFIGYSLEDPNIRSLLASIVSCLGQDNIKKLQKSLIFVRRSKGGEESISDTYMALGEDNIPITIVQTDDFNNVYEPIYSIKRKIPVRILRHCKEQLYEVVKSETPEKKMCVVDIDSIERRSDVEFVVGLGVAKERADAISVLGYKGLNAFDLFKDLIYEDKNFDAEQIIKDYKTIVGGVKYAPIYRYLCKMDIDSHEKLQQYPGGNKLNDWVRSSRKDFILTTYYKRYLREYGSRITDEKGLLRLIIAKEEPQMAAIFLSCTPSEDFDSDIIRGFLRENILHIDPEHHSPAASNFRKLACILDWEEYSWWQKDI
jgi:hypothetical protein